MQVHRAHACRPYRQQDEVVCAVCQRRYDVRDPVEERPECPRTGEPMEC